MGRSVIHLAASLLLLLSVAAAPWFFGGVYESTQVWLFSGVWVALACTLAAARGKSARWSVPPAMAILLLGIGWGCFQLVPIPKAFIAFLSPGAHHLRAELLPQADPEALGIIDLPQSSNDPEWQTVSLRPSATRQDLALLVLAVSAFFLGWQLFGTSRASLWLLTCIALNGAALAFFGLVQKLAWNGRLYWLGPEPANESPFAAFVNRNNAGGYLNLCLAAALGLTLWAAERHSTAGTVEIRTRPRHKPGLAPRPSQTMEFLTHLDALTLTALALSVCIIGAVLCTLSRGAALSLLAAGAFTPLVVNRARRSGGAAGWIALALLAGLGFVSWVGLEDALRARFDTFADGAALVTIGRVPNWLDAVHAVPDFWLTGSGLGTYRDIYLPYQHRYDPAWYYYAENQYLQALVEAGIVGLTLLLAAITAVSRAVWRLLARSSDSAAFALGVSGVFALVSQIIHAGFDFGLYLPANMLLMAVLCGSIVGRSEDSDRDAAKLASNSCRWAPALPTAIAFMLLACGIWCWAELRRAANVAQTMDAAEFAETPSGITAEKLTAAIESLSVQAAQQTDDAELHYRLAKSWIQLYRIHKLAALRSKAAPDISLETLWERTSTTSFHRAVQEAGREGRSWGLRALRNDLLVRSYLKPAIHHLFLARNACPILAKVHLQLARLCGIVGDPSADQIHLERARRLEPSSTYVLSRSGLLNLQAGRIAEACQDWRHCLELSATQLDEILLLANGLMSADQIVKQVLPAIPNFLIELAVGRLSSSEKDEVAKLLLARAAQLVEKGDDSNGERCHLLGYILRLQQRPAEAIEKYTCAVKYQPQRPVWRYELAILLREQGLIEEAREQATVCTRLEPQDTSYRQLLKDLDQTDLK